MMNKTTASCVLLAILIAFVSGCGSRFQPSNLAGNIEFYTLIKKTYQQSGHELLVEVDLVDASEDFGFKQDFNLRCIAKDKSTGRDLRIDEKTSVEMVVKFADLVAAEIRAANGTVESSKVTSEGIDLKYYKEKTNGTINVKASVNDMGNLVLTIVHTESP